MKKRDTAAVLVIEVHQKRIRKYFWQNLPFWLKKFPDIFLQHLNFLQPFLNDGNESPCGRCTVDRCVLLSHDSHVNFDGEVYCAQFVQEPC